MKTFTQLMDERHATYVAAKAVGFANSQLTAAWRESNREYVLARDTAAFKGPKNQVAA